MKRIYDLFKANQKTTPAYRVMQGLLAIFLSSSFLITIFLLKSFPQKSQNYVLSNSLIIILSITVSGFLIGFLFGIPRSVRYRFDKNNNSVGKNDTNDSYFADNTNLEEISDWLTKIIVGLTLIEGRKIVSWIENGANSIALSYPKNGTNLFVFSYSMMIFFSGLGFFGGYFWARTLLGSILAQSRKEQEDIINLVNRNLSNVDESTTLFDGNESKLSIGVLKEKVNNLLLNTPIKVKDDTQNGRWGGLSIVNDRILKVSVQPTYLGLFDVTIEVASTSINKPLDSPVVILLDSTFPENIVYLQPVGNIAKVTVVAKEAFTIGALCDNLDTKLELDMQNIKNLPTKFYWT